MQFRQAIIGALVALTTSHATAQSVVELPGVHASAETTCVDPARAASVGLSYDCLSQKMAATPAPVGIPQIGADISKRPTNSLGLYNASGLQNRMGQNLGISVQPYRPKVSYPTPLAPRPH